nr:unnamed protein product [Callosobruchus analis]
MELEIGRLNVCSLVPKFANIRDLITDRGYSIFAVSETWLNPNIIDEAVSIEGYNLVRTDRGTRGGVVALYIHCSLRYSILNVSTDIEQLWIKVSNKGQSCAVGVMYRPPHTNYKHFVDILEETLAICTIESDKVVCLGDININFLDTDLASTKYFSNMLEATGMHQIISEPTHITPVSCTLIDVILVNGLSLLHSHSVRGIDLTYHKLISCKLKNFKSMLEPFYYTYRSFSKFDSEFLYQDLYRLPLIDVCYAADIDLKLDIFNTMLLSLFNKHIPLKTSKITKNKPPWLTSRIKNLMKGRDSAKSKFKKRLRYQNWTSYKELRNRVNHAIVQEKRKYFTKVATNRDKRKLWKELKYLNISSQNAAIPTHLQNVEDINNYFIDSIPTIDTDDTIISFYNDNKICNSEFSFQLVSEEDVIWALCSTKHSAPGTTTWVFI